MSDEFMAGYGGEVTQKDLPSKGLHQAVCCQVHSLGHQLFKNQVSINPQGVFVFELDEKMKNGQMAGKPFVLSEKFAIYMGKKGKPSKLRLFLEKWKERAYTEEEASATNIKKCEGQPCTLNVDYEPKQDGTLRAVIVGISKRDPSKPPVPVTYTEVPKWIVEDKAKAVPPPKREMATTAAAGGPPPAEEDLPF
jgi:hypothetical protein